jgi:aminoglycoside 3-N-acetyltransferase
MAPRTKPRRRRLHMTERKVSLAGQLKQRLRPLYFNSQRLVARTLFHYSSEDLAAAVRSLGIGSGDSLLVHSGFRRASGFTGTPSDVIATLLAVLGPHGNLLMMSMPYRGSSQRYAESDPLFDVKRTPSAMGLISEVFRRRSGVLRSLNPLHPILAHGPMANWLVTDHEKTAYSCGKGSPFERFLRLDGKFLFFDAPYSALTFMHYVEDSSLRSLPVALYEPTPTVLRVRDHGGRDLKVRQYFFSKDAREHRNFVTIEQMLLRERRLRSGRIGNTSLLGVRAADVVDCARRLIDQGIGFYR